MFEIRTINDNPVITTGKDPYVLYSYGTYGDSPGFPGITFSLALFDDALVFIKPRSSKRVVVSDVQKLTFLPVSGAFPVIRISAMINLVGEVKYPKSVWKSFRSNRVVSLETPIPCWTTQMYGKETIEPLRQETIPTVDYVVYVPQSKFHLGSNIMTSGTRVTLSNTEDRLAEFTDESGNTVFDSRHQYLNINKIDSGPWTKSTAYGFVSGRNRSTTNWGCDGSPPTATGYFYPQSDWTKHGYYSTDMDTSTYILVNNLYYDGEYGVFLNDHPDDSNSSGVRFAKVPSGIGISMSSYSYNLSYFTLKSTEYNGKTGRRQFSNRGIAYAMGPGPDVELSPLLFASVPNSAVM